MSRISILLLALAVGALPGLSSAQRAFPVKPIHVMIPLVAQGFTIRASSPEELAAATRAQLSKYARLMKQAGIKAE